MAVTFWMSENLRELPGIVHGFTYRDGGVSTAPFGSLNLGLHVLDAPDAVWENRARVAAAFGLSLSRMVCAAQVHGGGVAVVGEADAGRGSMVFAQAIPAVDALVTNTPNLLLTLFYADCVPVFFADPVQRVVAVAHAGWRGMVAGVLENTVATMQSAFACEASSIEAAIAPCIGPAQFEVGDEVAARFDKYVVVTGFAKPHIDLAAAARQRLSSAGLTANHITVSGECTASEPSRYFSHRRDQGKTGRMAACIALRP